MLSSCANPSCSGKFRYLHEGKLFLLKSFANDEITTTRLDFAGRVNQLHYAWLCDRCAPTFEVVLDSEGKVKVRARYDFTGLAVAVAATVGVQFAAALTVACDMCQLAA